MVLCMVCLSTLLIRRSKHANALNVMFVETVDTLVFVDLTQHLIQSTMRCENSTLLYSPLYKVASHPCQDGRLFVTVFEKPSVLGVWLFTSHMSQSQEAALLTFLDLQTTL